MNYALILGVGGGLAVVMLMIGIVTSLMDSKNIVNERIDRYAGGDVFEEPSEQKALLTDWLNRRVAKSSLGDQIAKNLARADLKFKPGEFLATFVISGFAVGVLGWFIGGRDLIGGIIGIILGLALPMFYMRRQQGQRLIKFDGQLPDMLNLMVNGLRAGYSTMQAMEAVSKEMPAPICDEFRRVVQEMQLGVPMEKALDNLLRRIPSPDLDLLITAINVQREVGGNLAEIMDTISFTIRERVRIKGEIRVLTTQTMYSGKMLSLMPVAVILVLYFINRDYMMEFFKPDAGVCGFIALGLAALLIISGYFTMQKLSKIEV
jgi:tight adherence protein B